MITKAWRSTRRVSVAQLCQPVAGVVAYRLDFWASFVYRLHVARLKEGLSTTHPLRPNKSKSIKAWLAVHAKMKPATDAFFISERCSPLSRKTIWFMIGRYGERAGLPVDAHPHMLRHACGFILADEGADTRLIQDYHGRRNIKHTVKYTAATPARFERLWR
jgi:type 1 fimbriae regulatory protein FimB